MIISASYRTDIPAFYGAWFRNRLDAGFCQVTNPYNGAPYHVSLARRDVDAFVFWTKNAGPFLDTLATVHAQGYPFVVQYTINGYPRALETSVVDARRAVDHLHHIAQTYGPRAAVWRYDTVLVSSLTPLDFHRDNFARLSAALEGAADEVVISFAEMYRKTRRNLDAAARRAGFTWSNPPDEVKRALVRDLVPLAAAHGMQLTICEQAAYLVEGAEFARCVDVARLSDVTGYAITASERGHRPACGCYQSRDIGAYDTCPHGCVYCYAVRDHRRARSVYKNHDPQGTMIHGTSHPGQPGPPAPHQRSLFE